jgi:NAD(P)-dependent dehydrogenase (short-subunit alcohol dehydrogenase family)
MRPAAIDLERAVVAVTGAGRGIGRSTAELFAARGATVCVCDLDGEWAATTADEIGTRAHPFQVDVRSVQSFAELVRSIERTLGPIDVLVNNAGVMPTGSFLDESPATTDTVLSVNTSGPVHGMRLVLPGMIERGRGHIVNVASMLGKTELPGLATYIASKHALVGLTAAVRLELGGTGVTVTAVLPGVINTELIAGIQIPRLLGRLVRAEPEDVARAIVSSCGSRPREVAVPQWLAVFPLIRPFVPERVETLVRKLVGDDRALQSVDPQRRAAYRARIDAQSQGLSELPDPDRPSL